MQATNCHVFPFDLSGHDNGGRVMGPPIPWFTFTPSTSNVVVDRIGVQANMKWSRSPQFPVVPPMRIIPGSRTRIPEPSNMRHTPSAAPYYTFEFATRGTENVDLRASLVDVLNAYRVTLREHAIEVLYTELPEVPAQPDRVDRFYRTALGRVVQFGRESSPVVTIETQARNVGFDLVISAQRLSAEGKPERIHVVGRFAEAEATDSEPSAKAV